MKIFGIDRQANTVLFLLFATDLVFISLHLLCEQTEMISSRLYLLSTDRGFAESFQYIKEFWIILLICSAAIKVRSSLYFIWTAIFAWFLADDSLRLHEKIGGEMIGGWLHRFTMPNIEEYSYHIGQLLFAFLFGFLFSILIFVTYRISTDYIKRTSKYILFMLCSFVFFAVLVDGIKGLFDISALAVVEDGGEHIVMSLLVWLMLLIHMDANNEVKKL